jgi:photosystem II stability/assembly factor-like uncharacterized protein
MRILIVHLFLLTQVSSLAGCFHKDSTSGQLAFLGNIPQIRSPSFHGPGKASVVIEQTRELRITVDGGLTWREIPGTAVGGRFECATFLDDYRGWAVNARGQVFTTDSGGLKWKMLSELGRPSGGFTFISGNQIEFVNESDGWIMEALSIWRTSDGGVTWRETLNMRTEGVRGQPTHMHPIDSNTLVCSASQEQVYITRDAGTNWQIETLESKNTDFTDVFFVDASQGWIGGYVGGRLDTPVFFKTTDGGISWERAALMEDGIALPSICFLNATEGWVAGQRKDKKNGAVENEGVLLHTTDGGKHWVSIQLAQKDPSFKLVRFTDTTHGWLVARDNLYGTSDGGGTWRPLLILQPVP